MTNLTIALCKEDQSTGIEMERNRRAQKQVRDKRTDVFQVAIFPKEDFYYCNECNSTD